VPASVIIMHDAWDATIYIQFVCTYTQYVHSIHMHTVTNAPHHHLIGDICTYIP
jgi:hypothetical protein